MTYSQRLSGGASLSEVLYLEQQIDQFKEERVVAVEKLKQYEQVAENVQIKDLQKRLLTRKNMSICCQLGSKSWRTHWMN